MRTARVDTAEHTENLPDPATLPALASADPGAALIAALRWLETTREPASCARAHQAVGIVHRDRGDAAAAGRHLDAALLAAQRSRDRRIVVDVRATRGGTLARAGRTAEGLAELDLALHDATGADRAGVLMRRAWVRAEIGEQPSALEDLRRALTIARRVDDRLWQGRVLNLRCLVHVGLGLTTSAEADALEAESLFDGLGQSWMSAQARHNRAYCAALRGDLVSALRDYDDVARRYAALDIDEPMLAVDRVSALLAAGLAVDAAALAAVHLGAAPVVAGGVVGSATDRGPLLVASATAELAAGRPAVAQQRARAARRAFRTAGRPAWAGRAALLAARADFARGGRSARLLRDATVLAADPALFADDRLAAQLLTARVATARGDDDTARELLATLATLARRTRGPALNRATASLARALLAELDGDHAALRRACARGLDAVDEHRAVFGAVELRAAASVHGTEFADLAARSLLRRGTARQLLEWVERSRASVLAGPSPDTGADPELARRLALAREAAARARTDGGVDVAAAERRVHILRMTTTGDRGPARAGGTTDVLAGLDDRTLLALALVDGAVHTLTGRAGRVRRAGHVARLSEVRQEAEFLRFALRRAASGVGGTTAVRLDRAAQRLQDALFGADGPPVGPDGEIVIVPPASLHDLPWAALPAFERRVVVVAPSTAMWRQARVARGARRGGVVLALGPDLPAGEAELVALAEVHAGADVLGGNARPDATADAVLAAMNGARVVHLAAHGTLRADSPMFSALHVEGGPLFVHDIERLRRAPREVVLAACNSALGADVGADQLLGVATALLRAGTAAVLASTVAVGDDATLPFVVEVHRALARGLPLPAATTTARAAARAGGDPIALATALAFTVWGG